MKFDAQQDSFESQVLESDHPVLVDFWAEWCMPCKMMEPVLEELAGEYDGSLSVARVNVDEEGDLAMRYNVVSIPTLLLFKNGEIVGEHIGAAPKDTILEFVQPHLL
ncbi:MAG: thioredoxin [Spirochaeta sp.]|jgi:thioredoxin 1|nr:thioredoxin [Spirochaeta sp.]